MGLTSSGYIWIVSGEAAQGAALQSAPQGKPMLLPEFASNLFSANGKYPVSIVTHDSNYSLLAYILFAHLRLCVLVRFKLILYVTLKACLHLFNIRKRYSMFILYFQYMGCE